MTIQRVPAPAPAARAAEAPVGTPAASPGAGGARPALVQLRRRGRKPPRESERLADAMMARVGVTKDTQSIGGSVARAVLGHGLASVMGDRGSLRGKLAGHLFGRAAANLDGKGAAAGKGGAQTIGGIVERHVRQSVRRRIGASALGRSVMRSVEAAQQRQRIAAKAAAAPETDASPADLFGHESESQPEPASGEPPAPAIAAPPADRPVDLTADAPLAPVSVSMSGTMDEPAPGSRKDDEEEEG